MTRRPTWRNCRDRWWLIDLYSVLRCEDSKRQTRRRRRRQWWESWSLSDKRRRQIRLLAASDVDWPADLTDTLLSHLMLHPSATCSAGSSPDHGHPPCNAAAVRCPAAAAWDHPPRLTQQPPHNCSTSTGDVRIDRTLLSWFGGVVADRVERVKVW